MKITLLKPTEGKQARKTYALVGKQPKLTNAYDKMYEFRWGCTNVDGLRGFYALLDKCKDKNVLRIAGEPRAGLGSIVRRKKVNFLDNGTNLLLIDADDWPIPKGYNLRTSADIYRTVQHLLCDKLGLDFLKDTACVVMLSNSTWSYYNNLRAHIYFECKDKLDLTLLHKWGLAMADLNPTYKIDYSLYRQVQPDYISKRKCVGFNDPLPDGLRLTLHCDNLSPYVDKAALTVHAQSVIQQYEAFKGISTTGVVKNDGIGENWEQSLRLCGTAQHGINDPAYRACAQLVQQVGNKVVESNLNYYVEKVFNLAWTSINAHGVRNTPKDREHYNKSKFRGYLRTALQKHFGEDTDSISKGVKDALKRVIHGANPALLFDVDLLQQYRTLRTKNPGQWALFRNIVKTKLKGKVNLSDIEKALQSASKADIAGQIDQVIKAFDWVEGEVDRGLYCKKVKSGGYTLIGLDAGVGSDIYLKALELFDDAVPRDFEKNVLKVLAAKSRDETVTPFNKATVETRCHTALEGGENTMYFNCGENEYGDMATCVVSEGGVSLINSNSAPVVWNTSRQVMECRVTEPKPIGPDFDSEATKQVKGFIKQFRRFITTEDAEDTIDLMAWMVAAVVNTGTAPILEISGASGDGKSTTALFTKELIDPTSADIRDGQDLHSGFYKKEDLAKVLRARHITIFDNLSNLKPSTQDLLCSIATGWNYDLRIMYTQQFIPLNIKKPLILTSLAPIITNQDLRSRSISVNVSKTKKVQAGDIFEDWNRCKADMRLGFFTLVSMVIKHVNTMRRRGKDLNDRDLWATAARTVIMKLINYKKGNEKKISEAIVKRKVSRDIHEALLSSKSSQIIVWVASDVSLFNKNEVLATTTELYAVFKKWINANAGSTIVVHGIPVEVSLRSLPNNPRSFGIALSNIKNDLYNATGWDLSQKRSGGVSQRLFTKDPTHRVTASI